MKIRKLILNTKLQHIEHQYPYILVFHCSGLTNLQWRQLKNLLYINNGKTFFHPSGRRKLGAIGNTRKEMNSNLILSPGPLCIFYLTTAQIGQLDSSTWSELLKKINRLEHNTNLVLLYAQSQSNLMNHVDIKQAMNLDSTSVFQQLLWAINYPTELFSFCARQPGNELIQYQRYCQEQKKKD